MSEDTPEDKADRKKIFKEFDRNGDGRISARELRETLDTLGSITPDEVRRMMAEIDTDADGYISFKEFTAFAKTYRALIRDVAKII